MKHLELRRAGIVPALLLGLTGVAALTGCNSGGGDAAAGGGGGSDVLATVGGENITRAQLRDYVEGKQGAQALQTLIDNRLLQQSLKTKGGAVTDQEVTDELQEQLKDLQKQEKLSPPRPGATPVSKSFQDLLSEKGPRFAALQEDTRSTLTNIKVLTKDIPASEADLKTYFAKNHAIYDTPALVQCGALISSTPVRAKTLLAQLNNKSRTFKQLVDEQAKANDRAAGQSFYDRPISPDNLPPQLKTPLTTLKLGAISNVIALQAPGAPGSGAASSSIYFIFTVIKRIPGQKADFASVKSRVERAYKLEKLQATSPPGQVDPQTGQPVDPTKKILADLQHAGNVIISDPAYAPLATSYKVEPKAGSATGNTVTGSAVGNTVTGDSAASNAASGNVAG